MSTTYYNWPTGRSPRAIYAGRNEGTVPRRKRPGNPNWCKPKVLPREKPTCFELFVAEHQIPEERWADSRILRAWVKAHASQHWVPEELLTAIGVRVRADQV